MKLANTLILITVFTTTLIVLGLAIGLPLTVPRQHYSECEYGTKGECLNKCGCTWCDSIGVCEDDPKSCIGNYIETENCPLSYTNMTILIGILALLTVIDIIAMFALLVALYSEEKTWC